VPLKRVKEAGMIQDNIRTILAELPPNVALVAAAKTRSAQEILDAVEAGLCIVGENYIQEAEAAHAQVGDKVQWHMIGHLQRNKAKKAVRIFDMIETVDSMRLAGEIDKQCAKIDKVMEILVEVNSGEEEQKAGVLPADAVSLVRDLAGLEHVKVVGLMTMGPFAGDPEEARPYFIKTRALFEELKEMNIPGVEMRELSMGMSNSYKVAIEEGATMVRIGTKIFGERHYE
jgi:pyridoxal phosphate enzyme (YggS family)